MICWWMIVKLNTLLPSQGSPYIPVGIQEALRFPVLHFLLQPRLLPHGDDLVWGSGASFWGDLTEPEHYPIGDNPGLDENLKEGLGRGDAVAARQVGRY